MNSKQEIYVKDLVALKERPDFERLKYEAFAEQAYSYSRLGGPVNYNLSICLYEKCIVRYPLNYLWKFGLGLVYRRCTNCNLYCSSTTSQDIHQLASKCTALLFEVGEKGDKYLRGLAYSHLVSIRQYMNREEQACLFKRKSIWVLIKHTLKNGKTNPAVLRQCGKSFKSINVDKAIELLEKSLKLRQHGVTYHHLGLCLIKKADFLANGRYKTNNSHRKRFTQSHTSDLNSRKKNLNSSLPQSSFLLPSSLRNSTKSLHSSSIKSESSNFSQSISENRTNNKSSQPYNKPAGSTNLGLDNDFLKPYVVSQIEQLDPNDKLVIQAKHYFKRSLEITYGENLPAKQSLGDLYFKTGCYEKALAIYNQIINEGNQNYIITLLSALEFAGKSLQRMCETSELSQPEE
ncbi:hypothetical protein Bpfe_012392 [Biomphalaria pfeifferi]|uniref:Tetratricopeptide repeat protein n=1 Tax=Biomphalaria pfeifferi TaxID=112525 RepID=A0AAD8FBS3_BIOPF|nr:hypothetical protein Bpfe_012392 [Biomphalaria pfeifferi]